MFNGKCVMLDSDETILSGYHDDVECVLVEMTAKGYTLDEMRNNLWSVVAVAIEGGEWAEVFGVIDY